MKLPYLLIYLIAGIIITTVFCYFEALLANIGVVETLQGYYKDYIFATIFAILTFEVIDLKLENRRHQG